jgi:hypothetical protein
LAILSPAAQAQCIRCCFPHPSLSLSPASAIKGQPVMVISVLTNCRPYPQVITAKLNITPAAPCGSFAEAFSSSVLIPALQSRAITYTFSTPQCSGSYQVRESSSNASGTAAETMLVR